jgi:hypothetical protein
MEKHDREEKKPQAVEAHAISDLQIKSILKQHAQPALVQESNELLISHLRWHFVDLRR